MANPKERLPEPKDVLVEFTFVPRRGATVAGGMTIAGADLAGPRYRILRTLEVDEYEEGVPAANIMPLAVPLAAPSDNRFKGTARKAAKLSIAKAPIEPFDDIAALVKKLASHATMEKKKIPTDAGSDRVPEEKRNVRVGAFLYAASREDDNDYHLIVGCDPADKATYMTVEISGLPPKSSESFEKLKEVRDAYLEFFGDGLPGATYDFYDPPIPVEIEGSLFWDASHAKGGRPGPQKLRPKMPVVWEVHPVTKIRFET